MGRHCSRLCDYIIECFDRIVDHKWIWNVKMIEIAEETRGDGDEETIGIGSAGGKLRKKERATIGERETNLVVIGKPNIGERGTEQTMDGEILWEVANSGSWEREERGRTAESEVILREKIWGSTTTEQIDPVESLGRETYFYGRAESEDIWSE